MAADRYTFFLSFYESLKELPPEEFMIVISAMCEKVFYDKDPELSGHVKSLYKLIEPVLLKSMKISHTRSVQGRKGGAPIGNVNALKQTNSSKNKQKQTDKEEDKEEDKEKDIGIKNIGERNDSEKITPIKSKSFIPPTLDEVRKYCEDRSNNIDPESFIDYYSSKGWIVGKTVMKDWKAAVRTWEHRAKEQTVTKNGFNNFMTNRHTSDEIRDLENRLLEN